jgi:hypothetical protein
MRRDLQSRLERASDQRAVAAMIATLDVRDRIPPLFRRRIAATVRR